MKLCVDYKTCVEEWPTETSFERKIAGHPPPVPRAAVNRLLSYSVLA